MDYSPMSILNSRFALIVAVLFVPVNSLSAASCSVAQPHEPDEAEKALLAADYAKAVDLYKAKLASHPGDAELTAGLVRALLHEQKMQEAADAVKASLTVAPNSAALISLRGEVEYRQGTPWLAARTAIESEKLDPCYPRNHILVADILRLNSMYASSRKEIDDAHKLDPFDPDIRAEWIHTLSLKQRIAEAEKFLSVMNGNDEEDLRHWKLYLEDLKKRETEPHKPCHMVSSVAATEIPFMNIMKDATHIGAFGLDVKLNGHNARLQIDTGANGLLVSRSIAKHAGLKAFSQTEVNGLGDQGYKPGYTAYADSIRIGNLEFQDCTVEVLDSRSAIGDSDGLIGMDVLSHFLVTLDYPMRKLLLGPLPPRPGESAAVPALKTGDAERDESNDSAPGSQGTESGSAGVTASGGSAATQNAAPKKPAAHGPYDRYIAPEMKDYTPVYRVGHTLSLPASLNGGKPKLFILDTGSWSTTISPQSAREVTKVHSGYEAEVQGINGKVEKVYSADEVTIHFANLSQKVEGVASFDISRISKSVNMEISGLLGATTLNLLTIHIDYRDGLVKFDYDPKRGYSF
jgi:predicted aspartyl protease/Flp pilus assembly protein TadD